VQKERKKEVNTLARRRAALNASEGPTIPVVLRVKEAAEVSEMRGCARQRCAGHTGKVEY
jgi:hypothetical protein